MHHEIAKYHEIGRFAPDANEQKIDWSSALFHEDHAAMLGVPEAIVTMAKIYLHIPHDVLVSCVVPVSSCGLIQPHVVYFRLRLPALHSEIILDLFPCFMKVHPDYKIRTFTHCTYR